MTLSPLYAQQGLSVVTGVTDFINAGTSAKLASALQKYRNQMIQITAAMNERAISQNEIRTRDASVRLAFAIEATSQADIASANVSAATAGVSGRSVDRQLRGLRGSALRAQAARKEKTRQEMTVHANDRINNRVSAIMQRDITIHEKPSLMFAVGGIAKSLFNNTQDSTPPSEREKTGRTIMDWWQTQTS